MMLTARLPALTALTALAALAALAGLTNGITDEEYARFPRLYHLDDYSSCLAKSEGLYCVGSFHIHPPKQQDYTYELMKEYSNDPFNLNRTQIHRGYCVSERCPSAERNTTLRFEECAAMWGRRQKLQLELATFKYCKSHAQEYARKQSPEPYDLSQKTLLLALAVLCIANFIGSSYDWLSRDGTKKNDTLVLWSVFSNWKRLTATNEDGNPRLCALSPVQGFRVLLMLIIIGTHAGCIHAMLYLHNPRYVETVSRHPVFMIFMNGTSVVMVFVLVSSFLLAYNLLLLTHRTELRVSMLPLCVLKRVARITPVYLLVVGFAATFWPLAREGPMWPTLVEPESRICRDKFWAHALFINNLVRPDDHCLVQTWFLATDMQLYILAAVLTLWLARKRLAALPILAALTAASCVLNGALAYYFDWQSLLYHVYPSTMHTLYHGVESFYLMYTSPWGSLPACLVGLFLAHLHFEFEERGIKPAAYRLFRWFYYASPFLIVGWILAGNWVREVTDPTFTAFYLALERPILSLLGATFLLGLFNGIPGFYHNFLGWRGWYAMGRMSLSVLMLHWIINTCIAASRPQPIATSFPDVIVDFMATGGLTYIAAIPLTIMVEMPILRMVNLLVFKRFEKYNGEVKSQFLTSSETVKSQDGICSNNKCNTPEQENINNDFCKRKQTTDMLDNQQEVTSKIIKPQMEPIRLKDELTDETNRPQEEISADTDKVQGKSTSLSCSLEENVTASNTFILDAKINESRSFKEIIDENINPEKATHESIKCQKNIADNDDLIPQEKIIECTFREDQTTDNHCSSKEDAKINESRSLKEIIDENINLEKATHESIKCQKNIADNDDLIPQEKTIECTFREDQTTDNHCSSKVVKDNNEIIRTQEDTIDCDAIEAHEEAEIEPFRLSEETTNSDDSTSETGETTRESFGLQEKDTDIVVFQEELIDCDSDKIRKDAINETFRPEVEDTNSHVFSLGKVSPYNEAIVAQVETTVSDAQRQEDINEIIRRQEENDRDEQLAKEDGFFRTLIVTMRRTFKVI